MRRLKARYFKLRDRKGSHFEDGRGKTKKRSKKAASTIYDDPKYISLRLLARQRKKSNASSVLTESLDATHKGRLIFGPHGDHKSSYEIDAKPTEDTEDEEEVYNDSLDYPTEIEVCKAPIIKKGFPSDKCIEVVEQDEIPSREPEGGGVNARRKNLSKDKEAGGNDDKVSCISSEIEFTEETRADKCIEVVELDETKSTSIQDETKRHIASSSLLARQSPTTYSSNKELDESSSRPTERPHPCATTRRDLRQERTPAATNLSPQEVQEECKVKSCLKEDDPTSFFPNTKEGKSLHHGVSFGKIHTREFERVVGDNPAVREGVPISLGWNYHDNTKDVDVDEYEKYRQPQRRTHDQMKIPSDVREIILKEQWGVPSSYIRQAKKEAQIIRQKRIASRNFGVLGSCSRKLKKIIYGKQNVVYIVNDLCTNTCTSSSSNVSSSSPITKSTDEFNMQATATYSPLRSDTTDNNGSTKTRSDTDSKSHKCCINLKLRILPTKKVLACIRNKEKNIDLITGSDELTIEEGGFVINSNKDSIDVIRSLTQGTDDDNNDDGRSDTPFCNINDDESLNIAATTISCTDEFENDILATNNTKINSSSTANAYEAEDNDIIRLTSSQLLLGMGNYGTENNNKIDDDFAESIPDVISEQEDKRRQNQRNPEEEVTITRNYDVTKHPYHSSSPLNNMCITNSSTKDKSDPSSTFSERSTSSLSQQHLEKIIKNLLIDSNSMDNDTDYKNNNNQSSTKCSFQTHNESPSIPRESLLFTTNKEDNDCSSDEETYFA